MINGLLIQENGGVSENEKIAEVMDNETFEYLVKSDIKIEDVVMKIKERLNSNLYALTFINIIHKIINFSKFFFIFKRK